MLILCLLCMISVWLLCTSGIFTKMFKITKDFHITYALLHQFHAKMFFFQMLRKSVETRDCLSSIEPRNVRAVMKRVIEDVTGIDSLVGQLYEEGIRTERTSDSTRRSYTYSNQRQASRSQWSFAPRYSIDVSIYEEHHPCQQQLCCMRLYFLLGPAYVLKKVFLLIYFFQKVYNLSIF